MTIRTAIKDDNRSRAEWDLFRIACSLGEEWSVWMDRVLTFDCEGLGAMHREVDCVLYHKRHGMLLIECKSGTITTQYNQEAQCTEWFQAGKLMERSPNDQVCSLISPLHDYFKQILGDHRVRIQWAVCFNDMDTMQGIPQSEIPRRRALLRPEILDGKKFEQRIIEILETPEASHQNSPFPNEQLGEDTLFELTSFLDGNGDRPNEADIIRNDDPYFEQATELQQMMMDSISRNPRMRIEGVAGSGKSKMVVWQALKLARESKNVAIACYNDLLAHELKEATARVLEKDRKKVKEIYGKDGGVGYGRIEVNAYSEWCKKYAKAAQLDIRNNGNPDKYYNTDLPQGFDRAQKILKKNKKTREQFFFDAVIIDEGQDFTSGWVNSMISLLKAPEQGTVRFFYDPAQRLYGKRDGIDNGQVLAMPIITLNRGFRNTKNIVEWVRKNTGFHIQCYNNTSQGRPVKEMFYRDPAEQVNMLLSRYDELVRKYKFAPEDILVVSMHSKESSALKALKDDRFAWSGVGERKLKMDRVNIVSAHRIKGLDARAVILVDTEEPSDSARREDWKRRLLVGATRAKTLLTVFRPKAKKA